MVLKEDGRNNLEAGVQKKRFRAVSLVFLNLHTSKLL